MELRFVDYKSDLSYVALLAKITFKYCNNYDGKIYTTYSKGGLSNNLIETLIDQLTPLIVNKNNAIILNLLVNPFFDDLCDYLSRNPKISTSKINIIKKHIFAYLSDENTKRLYSDLSVEGAEIYIKHNMYLKSKKILEEMKMKFRRKTIPNYGSKILNEAYEKFFNGEHMTYEEFVIMLSTNDELYFYYNGREYQVEHFSKYAVYMSVTRYEDNETILERSEEFSSIIDLLQNFKIDGKRIHEVWEGVEFANCRILK